MPSAHEQCSHQFLKIHLTCIFVYALEWNCSWQSLKFTSGMQLHCFKINIISIWLVFQFHHTNNSPKWQTISKSNIGLTLVHLGMYFRSSFKIPYIPQLKLNSSTALWPTFFPDFLQTITRVNNPLLSLQWDYLVTLRSTSNDITLCCTDRIDTLPIIWLVRGGRRIGRD